MTFDPNPQTGSPAGSRLKKVIASTAIAATMLTGGVAIGSGAVLAQDTPPPVEDTTERGSRHSAVLDQLVADGVITQEQADAVSTAVVARQDERSAQRAERREAKAAALAEVLGISVEDLSAAREEGLTIAEIAEANGVPVDDVIEALVQQADERIDQAIEDGRIDAAQAEERRAELNERITARVNGEKQDRGDRRGQRGPAGEQAEDLDTNA